SADNLTSRDSGELAELFDIIAELATELSGHDNWRIQHVGSRDCLPERLIDALHNAETESAGRNGLHINLAVGYGGRSEIIEAVRQLIETHRAAGGTLDTLPEAIH